MASQSLPLGSLFPAASRDAWLAEVDKVLDGAPFDRRLVTRTYDGLAIEPLYAAGDVGDDDAGAPGLAPFTRGATAGARSAHGWDVTQLYAHPALESANRAILADLEGGVRGVRLQLGAGGLPVTSQADLDAVLAGVFLEAAPVWLDAGPAFAAAAAWLEALWTARGVPASEASGSFGADPLGAQARTGSPADLSAAAALAARTVSRFPQVRALVADGSVYADAGASDAQELGFALATAVAYLRACEAEGMAMADAAGQLTLVLSVNADQFASCAKLRAARRCWARVAEACGLAPEARSVRVEAVTSAAMYSQRDPWVNLLRATLAGFAAGTGGADGVTVLPFDWALGVPDEDGLRLARNTQLILLEECQLARVTDPAGGSWYVERRSEDLATEAWRRFQEVESQGGMAAALDSGWATAQVDATWQAKLANLAKRKDALTGVSEFADLDETVLARSPWPDRSATGAFPLRRLAAPFEALRDAADRAAQRPTVFLANLGPVAVHTARATFAKNFFEAGGIAALANDGFTTPDEAAAAFSASGAKLAIICSSDKVYADQAITAARALKAAGAEVVYLAGNPGAQRSAYEAAGIDDFAYMGCDVVASLAGAHRKLGL